MNAPKPTQFDIRQAKKQQQWQVDLQAANTEFSAASQQATEIAQNRLACVSLCLKADAIKDPIELATKLEEFVNAPINSVKFPKLNPPVMDSNLVS